MRRLGLVTLGLGLLTLLPSATWAEDAVPGGTCCTPATVTWVPVRTLRPVLAPVVTCRPVSCCPAPVPQTYAPQSAAPAQTSYQPVSPAPLVVYQPVVAAGPQYVLGRGILGQPKLYVEGQPVRNFLRWLSP